MKEDMGALEALSAKLVAEQSTGAVNAMRTEQKALNDKVCHPRLRFFFFGGSGLGIFIHFFFFVFFPLRVARWLLCSGTWRLSGRAASVTFRW